MTHNTIIIGAGPAGIAAAIQLKRAGQNFLILDKGPIGGLLNNASWVENYPGFPEGISGPDLVDRLRNHLEFFDIPVISDEVKLVKNEKETFHIETEDTFYRCKNLIVASGTKPRKLDPSIYNSQIKNNIYYKVYKLKNIKNKHIAVVGSGDAAFDYSLNIAFKNKISVLYRSAKCLPLLYKRACKIDSIRLYPKTEIVKIEKHEARLKIETANPYHKTLYADAVLAAIGRDPCNGFLSPEIYNHLLEKRDMKGLYYAGDVTSGVNRQVAIAVGDGIKTAMDIIRESS